MLDSFVLSQKKVAKSWSVHNFFPKRFCYVIWIISSTLFLFSRDILSTNFKKISFNSFNSALIISIFSSSLFRSKLEDCLIEKFVITVLNDFRFLLFIMNFHDSDNHFVEVRKFLVCLKHCSWFVRNKSIHDALLKQIRSLNRILRQFML